MAIEVEAKFNSGSGGVMIIVTKHYESGYGPGNSLVHYEKQELGELVSPRKAIDLALLILHKATDVPPEVDTAIRKLKDKV